MKRVLIISPHWPPVNAPDHQRVRMCIPFYTNHGWKPTVLAVAPEDVHATLEPDLSATVPAETDVRTVRVDASWLWQWLGVGSIGLRAFTALAREGTRILRRESYDLIFFSNTQFITYALGLWWKWRFHVPYLIDLQDPWRTNYYERPDAPRPPGGWKYQFARLLAWMLESPVYRHSAGFISVSQNYLDDLRARYSWFGTKPSRVIHFGVALRDLDTARSMSEGPHHFSKKDGEIHLLYTGAAGPIMPHALNTLFRGFHTWSQSHPLDASRFRFHFYGTSYVAPGTGWPSVMPVAAQYGMEHCVDEIPHRLGHLESLALQLHTDALILLGSSDLAYSPSKIYPYYLSERPILSVIFKDSYLESMLEKLRCSYTVRFEPGKDIDRVNAELATFFDWALKDFPPGKLAERNRQEFERLYLARHLVITQCDFFNALVRPS
jgi:hypothetical protein